ncbi:uncharacterized protein LOC111053702 isoform X2 [Nilaparvata lugens]|nr:uncharacterized protein LOC111053702 isoform X2 [Nilaparvata lugens]
MIRGDVTPRRRLSSDERESRIPVPSSPILRRSGSVRSGTFSPIAEHARNGISTIPTTTSRTPPLNRHRSLQCLSTPVSACLSPDRDDDMDSVQSFGSSAGSTASQCDHASFARNGTTYSGRHRRFVVHCSPHSHPDAGHEYLTPTQRANLTIRKLKQLLQDKQTELTDKEREIFRLTKEVVELRLVKAGSTIDVTAKQNGSPSPSTPNKSIFNDLSTPSTPVLSKQRVNGTDQSNSPSAVDGVSPSPAAVLADVPASLVDSGHFEDLNSSSGSCVRDHDRDRSHDRSRDHDRDRSRDWPHSPHSSPPATAPSQTAVIDRIKHHHEDVLRDVNEKHRLEINHLKNIHDDLLVKFKEHHSAELVQLKESHNAGLSELRERLNAELSELKERHNAEISEMKGRHNDKVDSLLQRITEANDRFCELRPKLEEAESRIKSLSVENEELKRTHQESEEKHKAIYLEMYNKGHEAAKLESDMHQGNGDAGSNSVMTENEKLLKELNLTKKDLENVKDKDFVSSQNLLSAKEAISLWNLVRKANYRRLQESRQSVSQQDPEITLNFLKSAVYYFLTDRENSQRHLSAIESILGFTDNEKMNIEKAFLWR